MFCQAWVSSTYHLRLAWISFLAVLPRSFPFTECGSCDGSRSRRRGGRVNRGGQWLKEREQAEGAGSRGESWQLASARTLPSGMA